MFFKKFLHIDSFFWKNKSTSENVAHETHMHQHSLAFPATKTKNKEAQITPHTGSVVSQDAITALYLGKENILLAIIVIFWIAYI